MNPKRAWAARKAIQGVVAILTFVLSFAGTHAPSVRAQGCIPLPPYAVDADRIGINVLTDYGKTVFDYNANAFGAGWFIDYQPRQLIYRDSAQPLAADHSVPVAAETPNVVNLPVLFLQPPYLHTMGYVHVLRATDFDGNWRGFVDDLVARYPGMIWAIGNEQDRRTYQDDKSPLQYATLYHDAYHYIKQRDPTSKIAIGAIVQPTPIRLRYLNAVLAEYRRLYGTRMPVDVWNIHAFILREVDPADYPPGSFEVWGAGIPPGMDAFKSEAIKYNVSDHGNLEILKQFTRDFRTWMAGHGYRNTPLIITEYGILMRPDYDAGNGRVYDHEFVTTFMRDSFSFFLNERDSLMGYPEDDNRLVQAWAWYALNTYTEDPDPTDGIAWQQLVNGYLLDHNSGETIPLGHDFTSYTAAHGSNASYIDLAFLSGHSSPRRIPAGVAGRQITVHYSIRNRGNVVAPDARVRIWLGDPDHGGTLLATQNVPALLEPRCRELYEGQATVTLPALSPGDHQITVVAIRGDSAPDRIAENNRLTIALEAVTATAADQPDLSDEGP